MILITSFLDFVSFVLFIFPDLSPDSFLSTGTSFAPSLPSLLTISLSLSLSDFIFIFPFSLFYFLAFASLSFYLPICLLAFPLCAFFFDYYCFFLFFFLLSRFRFQQIPGDIGPPFSSIHFFMVVPAIIFFFFFFCFVICYFSFNFFIPSLYFFDCLSLPFGFFYFISFLIFIVVVFPRSLFFSFSFHPLLY